jgi:crotonobetainyl-CoA:carnitine CoA-transferase CaiB-like acyl-CoA transferase
MERVNLALDAFLSHTDHLRCLDRMEYVELTSTTALAGHGCWDAEMGSLLVNKPPFRTVGEERCIPGPPPLLGQHTVEVATTLLGFDEAECRRLIEEKVFF